MLGPRARACLHHVQFYVSGTFQDSRGASRQTRRPDHDFIRDHYTNPAMYCTPEESSMQGPKTAP